MKVDTACKPCFQSQLARPLRIGTGSSTRRASSSPRPKREGKSTSPSIRSARSASPTSAPLSRDWQDLASVPHRLSSTLHLNSLSLQLFSLKHLNFLLAQLPSLKDLNSVGSPYSILMYQYITHLRRVVEPKRGVTRVRGPAHWPWLPPTSSWWGQVQVETG